MNLNHVHLCKFLVRLETNVKTMQDDWVKVFRPSVRADTGLVGASQPTPSGVPAVPGWKMNNCEPITKSLEAGIL